MCATATTCKNSTSVILTLQDVYYDVGHDMERSKNSEAENMGSSPAPAAYKQPCDLAIVSLSVRLLSCKTAVSASQIR